MYISWSFSFFLSCSLLFSVINFFLIIFHFSSFSFTIVSFINNLYFHFFHVIRFPLIDLLSLHSIFVFLWCLNFYFGFHFYVLSGFRNIFFFHHFIFLLQLIRNISASVFKGAALSSGFFRLRISFPLILFPLHFTSIFFFFLLFSLPSYTRFPFPFYS